MGLAADFRRFKAKAMDDVAQREEAERLRERVTHLEDELAEMRRQLNQSADSIAAKDAELALLRGRLRQVLALAQSYEAKLTEHGIPHEQPSQPFWRVEAGDYPTELEPSI